MEKAGRREARGRSGKYVRKHGIGAAYASIRQILETARSAAYRAVNFAMVVAYWQIGRVIVEEEQKGKARAEYGRALVKELSGKLTRDYGEGFTERNLWYVRDFYLKFPKMNALRSELSWTHYRLLLRVENERARRFYLAESLNCGWSTRELERQISSLFYERIALSKDERKVRELSKKGQIIKTPVDLIKDPYVLEFLGLSNKGCCLERDVEALLADRLKDFLLELGKGFSFVARQKRISVGGDHYYVDLVFYNYLLKCFVLVDLKVGKLTHGDIGQMDFYVRYFEREERRAGDNPSIGLILCSDRNEAMARYTLLSGSRTVFASKYKLYLPSEEELRREMEKERARAEQERALAEP